jgi:SAM-dependent methyltransferase
VTERVELYRRLPRQPEDTWWAELAGASPDGRVLELGAGTGRLTAVLLATGARVTAVERDPAMVAALREDQLGDPGRSDLEVVEADVTALPDGPRVGMVALPASLLNELPDAAARRATLIGAARRCRADGRVALHLLAPWWLVGMSGRSVGRLVPADGTPPIEVTIDAGPFAPWPARRQATLRYGFADGAVLVDHLDAAVVSPGELETAIAAAGLEIVAVHGSIPPAPIAEGDVAWHLLLRPADRPSGATSVPPRHPA